MESSGETPAPSISNLHEPVKTNIDNLTFESLNGPSLRTIKIRVRIRIYLLFIYKALFTDRTKRQTEGI